MLLDDVPESPCPRSPHARRTLFALLASAPLALAACGQSGSAATDVPAKDTATAAAAQAPSGAPAGTAAATAVAASPDPTASPGGAASGAPGTPAVTAAGAESPTKQAQNGIAAASGAPTASAATTASAAATASPSASATAAASAAPALTVQTAALTESGFSVWMQSAKSYKVGQTSAVQVVLVPKGEFHCNEKYPYKVKLGSPPAGISYPQEIVRDASVSATRTSITVPFTPTAAGDARITGKFSFSVCKADQCVIDAREVAATVKVE